LQYQNKRAKRRVFTQRRNKYTKKSSQFAIINNKKIKSMKTPAKYDPSIIDGT